MLLGSLQLLLDQGVPRDAVQFLRSAGIDSIHVGELGMFASSDTEILEWARAQNRLVVTVDADFHAILMLHQSPAPSVIRIRLQGLDGRALANILSPVLHHYEKELIAGCMITVKQHKTTCHMLSR